jgi:hypothetical protein
MYLIEIKAISGDQQLWINGVQIGTTQTSVNIDDQFTAGAYMLQGSSGVWYFDDLYINDTIASASGQTGRRGSASVRSLSPVSDVGSAPAGFTNSAGLIYGDPSTGWFSAIDDPPPFLASSSDFLGKSVADAVNAEFNLAPTPAGAAPTAVTVVAILSTVSAGGAVARVTMRSNGVDQAFAGYAPSVTTPLVGVQALDLADVSTVWTKALLDASTVKFGNSTDVTPNPKLNAVYVMYETIDVPPPLAPVAFRSHMRFGPF